MSRSYRHTPIVGITTARSEKQDKRIWHGRFRSHERDHLRTCQDWEAYLTTHFRSVSNPWSMDKDGRQFLDLRRRPRLKRYMRK